MQAMQIQYKHTIMINGAVMIPEYNYSGCREWRWDSEKGAWRRS